LLRCTKKRSPSPCQMISATPSDICQIRRTPPRAVGSRTKGDGAAHRARQGSTNLPRNCIRRARVPMLSRPHRIKDDDRNTRVDRAAFPRPQRDRIDPAVARRLRFNPRAVIAETVFATIIGLAIGIWRASSRCSFRARRKAPASTSQPRSLAASSRFRLAAART